MIEVAQRVLESGGFPVARVTSIYEAVCALHLETGVRIVDDGDGAFQVDFDPGPHPLEGYAPSFGPQPASAENLVDVVRAVETQYSPFVEKLQMPQSDVVARVAARFTPAPPAAIAALEATIDSAIADLPYDQVGDLRTVYEAEIVPRLVPPAVRVVPRAPVDADEIGVIVDDWRFAAIYRGATVRAMVDLADLVLKVGPTTRGPGIPEAFFDFRIAGEVLTVRINGFRDTEVVGTVITSRGPRWIRGSYARGDLRWSPRVPLASSISPPLDVEEAVELDRFIAAMLDDVSPDHLSAFVAVGIAQTEHWLERVRSPLRSRVIDPAHRQHLLSRERQLFAERRAIELAARSGRYIPLPAAPVPYTRARRRRREG